MSRREWVLLVAFVLCIAAAATAPIVMDKLSGTEPPSPPPKASPPPNACPDTVDGEPKHPTEYTNRAAPYTGPGPHSMELVAPVTDVDGIHQYHSVDDRLLPSEWLVYDDEDKWDLQLFVCEYAVAAGYVKDSCQYIPQIFVQLVPATYRYRVFEARTAKPVKEFTLESGNGCPGSIQLWNGEAPARILESVEFDVLENALRPIVDP
jgi:hypothetical protein